MRTALERITAYDARMQSSTVDPSLVAVNAQQMANHAEHVAFFYPFQLALRDWMNANGYSGNQAFAMEAFNGECYAIKRRFEGPAAVAQATVLVAKYTATGQVALDLKAVALQVWGWTVV